MVSARAAFVKNVVLCEGSRKDQLVDSIWPASDELEVHIGLFKAAR
jgi:hypothetical protein